MAKKKKNKESPVAEEQPIAATNNPKKMDSFYAWDGETLIINVLGTPSAKRDQIGKPFGNQLKISVKESPRNGRATDYMLRFLADEFDVSPKDIEVVLGRFNINKQLRITNPKKLPAQITHKMESAEDDIILITKKGKRKKNTK